MLLLVSAPAGMLAAMPSLTNRIVLRPSRSVASSAQALCIVRIDEVVANLLLLLPAAGPRSISSYAVSVL